MAKNLSDFATPDFFRILPDYEQIRDCSNGSRAIKVATTKYLPMLKGQTTDDYVNYLARALFFPITGKTSSTLVGLAIATPPKITMSAEMSDYFTDNSPGNQFSELLYQIMGEVVLMGRYGVLIDAAPGGPPKPVTYIAENIVRWEVNEYGIPYDIMLREFVYDQHPQDEFVRIQRVQYRRCQLVDGLYTVTVLDENLVMRTMPQVPLFTGSPATFIPFVPFGATGVHFWPDRPPMLDISTINLSHYLSSADLEWGRHLTGLPTPVVSGVDSSTVLHIGGTAAWILPDTSAKAYYMEFLGQGLGSLEKAMSEKVGLMASMSARLIDVSSKGSEAAETVRLRYASDSASLIHIIASVECGLNAMYDMIAKLAKVPKSVVSLSRDVLGSTLTFKDLSALYEAYFKGGMSKESLLYNLRRLGAADPNRTDAEELAAIRAPLPIVAPTN